MANTNEVSNIEVFPTNTTTPEQLRFLSRSKHRNIAVLGRCSRDGKFYFGKFFNDCHSFGLHNVNFYSLHFTCNTTNNTITTVGVAAIGGNVDDASATDDNIINVVLPLRPLLAGLISVTFCTTITTKNTKCTTTFAAAVDDDVIVVEC